MKAWAESRGNGWFIISAKYGLVDRMGWVEPYDEVGLSKEQSHEIAETLFYIGAQTVDITAGKKYTNPLTPELEEHGIDVREVCRGMEIGNRISRLQTLSRKKENHTL